MIRFSAFTLAVSVLAAVPLTAARPVDAGPLRITHAWIRTPPPGAPTAAAYLTIVNRGKSAERLLGAVSPEAKSIEPHVMSTSGGVMRMRSPIAGFGIAPGATFTLWPGGGHLMLVGVRHPLRAGERVPISLRFARAGQVKVDFVVQDQPPLP
jgi:copper(I)-binding protein